MDTELASLKKGATGEEANLLGNMKNVVKGGSLASDEANAQALAAECSADLTKIDQLPAAIQAKATAAYGWASDKIKGGYEVICPTETEAEEKEVLKAKTAADCFKKFLFSAVKFSQVYLVIQIMQGVSVPPEVGPPTTGQFTYYIPLLVFVAFITQFLDFAFSCAPLSAQAIRVNNSIQAITTTAVINQLATPDWGAKGEMVTILQEVMKNQALLNALDLGFINALFPLPNFVEIAERKLSEFFQFIYDCVFAPTVNFFRDNLVLPVYNFVSQYTKMIWDAFMYVVGLAWDLVCMVVQAILDTIMFIIGQICQIIVTVLKFIVDGVMTVVGHIQGLPGVCKTCYESLPSCSCPSCEVPSCPSCIECSNPCVCVEKVYLEPHFRRIKRLAVNSAKTVSYIGITYHDGAFHPTEHFGDKAKTRDSLNTTWKIDPDDFIKRIELWQTTGKLHAFQMTTYKNKKSDVFGAKGEGAVPHWYDCKPGELGIIGFRLNDNADGCSAITALQVQKADGTVKSAQLEKYEAVAEVKNCDCCGVKIAFA